MSRPRIEVHPWLTEEVTREQPLKMTCPGCAQVFYWVEHSPYCSDECRVVETAADLLIADRPSFDFPTELEGVYIKDMSSPEDLKQGIIRADVSVKVPAIQFITLDVSISV